jgi:hypothetical protein
VGNSASLELEIQHLLKSGQSPPEVAKKLIHQLSADDYLAAEKDHLPELQTLGRFCLKAGELPLLLQFLARELKARRRIPWDIFVEALFGACAAVPEDFKKSIVKGAEKQKAFLELTLVHHLDYFDERIVVARKLRAEELRKKAEKLKSHLLDELRLMKNQRLEEPQEAHLQKLDRLFPEDSEVKDLVEAHKEKRVLRALEKKSHRPWVRPFSEEPPDATTVETIAAINSSMEEILEKTPELALDFSISHLMWENHRSALRFLEKSPESAARGWLKAHLLLASRRFVDLLQQLPEIESRDFNNPEAAFEATYLRSQAHWGLGDRVLALELMERLLEQRPDYRSASSLLAEWKESFT